MKIAPMTGRHDDNHVTAARKGSGVEGAREVLCDNSCSDLFESSCGPFCMKITPKKASTDKASFG